MALGKTAFHGTVKDLIKFFASLGDPTLRVPESYNPADHVIAKLSVSEDTSDEDEERVQYITEKFHESITGAELRHLIEVGSTKLESNEDEETEKHRGKMGSEHSYKEKMEKVEEVIKDMNLGECKNSLIGIPNRRKGISVGEKKRLAFASEITSVAIGIVNFQTEVYGPSIQNLEGVMYNCVRDMSFLFFYPSINVITSELPVFLRESKARIYSPEAYFISKSLAEMPQYIVLPLIYSAILYWMTGLAPTARQFIIFSLANVFQSLNAISIGECTRTESKARGPSWRLKFAPALRSERRPMGQSFLQSYNGSGSSIANFQSPTRSGGRSSRTTLFLD
ncbi:ABC-2 type transporter [Necator americanus]|uniref:ABC-2 type transporter n=1 Tax=Necator americanus TaxID=51031 RepID=W2T930_NECAM|nr:ABC-2 type transporter [Necator americanus]ETN78520.1 ABC-2 type transporter [Necator americanus]